MSIIMAFTDPIDTDPPETRYRYFTDEFTGEGLHWSFEFESIEEFINTWIRIYDKPYGMWYWVLDDGKCICSGACDPDDIDIFIEHWCLEEYSDKIHDSMNTKKHVYLNSEKEKTSMATATTRKTKEMLLQELEAKNAEIKELKKEIEKAERLKQFDEAAGELSAYRDSFIKAGFTKTEASEFIKVLLTNSVRQFAK